MKFQTLLCHLYIYQYGKNDNPEITDICTDSRQTVPGSLFVCVRGATVDGHDYAASAVEKGAVAVVSEKPLSLKVPVAVVPDSTRASQILANVFYGHPSKDMHVVGVTGTNGKTTTTNLIERIFRDSGKKCGLIGTIGMKLAGHPLRIQSSTPTTPEAVTLQKGMSRMRKEGAKAVVMEVSSHALAQGRVRGVDFNVAVFTNLTRDHLEYHHSMEDYLHAKSLLFSQLGNTYNNEKMKAAVLNADDAPSYSFLRKSTAVQVMTYGIESRFCDVRARQIQLSAEGTSFRLETPAGEAEIFLQLIGKFNVYNALAAAACGLLSGIELQQIKKSLEAVPGIPGRFERVDEGQPYTVIVDYAHSPDSLQNVLETVQQFARGRVYVVCGCGGDRDKAKRPLMARCAVQYSDGAIFTSDNPRNEDSREIIRDMETGVDGGYEVIVDRRMAIRAAIARAKRDDIVVIAGKGHETYQIVKGKTYPFDDRYEARQAIKENQHEA